MAKSDAAQTVPPSGPSSITSALPGPSGVQRGSSSDPSPSARSGSGRPRHQQLGGDIAKCVRRVAQRDPRSRLHARALRTRTCAASLWSAVVGAVTAPRRQSLRLTCSAGAFPPLELTRSAVRPYAAAFVHALHPVHSVSLGASAVAVNVAVKPPRRDAPRLKSADCERGIVVSRLGFEPRTRGSRVSAGSVHGVPWSASLSRPRGLLVHGLRSMGPSDTAVAVNLAVSHTPNFSLVIRVSELSPRCGRPDRGMRPSGYPTAVPLPSPERFRSGRQAPLRSPPRVPLGCSEQLGAVGHRAVGSLCPTVRRARPPPALRRRRWHHPGEVAGPGCSRSRRRGWPRARWEPAPRGP